MSPPRMKGTGFPPRIGSDGRVVWSTGEDHVRESIRLILMTDRNERIMLPEFGAGLGRFLFAPNTVATHRLIEEAIVHALVRWEPRIVLEGVSVQRDVERSDVAIAEIRYRLRSTGSNAELSIEVPLAR